MANFFSLSFIRPLIAKPKLIKGKVNKVIIVKTNKPKDSKSSFNAKRRIVVIITKNSGIAFRMNA